MINLEEAKKIVGMKCDTCGDELEMIESNLYEIGKNGYSGGAIFGACKCVNLKNDK